MTPCKKIGNAIVCSNTVVEHKGFTIEFPKIGSPAMLNKDFEIVDDPPQEFWEAVEDYQYRHAIEIRLNELENRIKVLEKGE